VAPDVNADVIATLADVRLPITGVSPDRRWFRVERLGQSGWIRQSSFVSVEGSLDLAPVIEIPSAEAARPVLVVGHLGSQVRVAPDVNADVITTVADARLPITGVSPDRRWFRVERLGQSGWIRQSSFVSVEGSLDLAPVIEIPGAEAARPVLVVGHLGSQVRVAPDVNADVIATIADARLPITGVSPDRRWFRVERLGQSGWIRQSSFVSVEGNLDLAPVIEIPGAEAARPVLAIGHVGVQVRTGPDIHADLIATPADARLPITGVSPDRRWFRVEWLGQPGWVRQSAFVSVEGNLDLAPVIEVPAGEAAQPVLVIGHVGVQVRTGPDIHADLIATPADARLPITGVSADRRWFRVEWLGQPGWVRQSAFVSVEGNLDLAPVID
jgi:SH3-like domain-containing protein